MKDKTPKFLIGLFVTVGILLGVLTVIWLGASKYFQKGAVYATYFDESVQGLSVDSSVKYRGVGIGSVRAMRVAPDHRLIEVVMKIDIPAGEEGNITAQLKSAGLTGVVYVELNRRRPGDADLSPSIGFTPQHPVILSIPSETRYLLAAVGHVLGEIKAIDLRGLFAEISSIARSIDDVVGSERLGKILVNLDHLTEKLDRTAGRIEEIAKNREIEGVMGDARLALSDLRGLIQGIREEVQQLRAPEAVAQAGQTMAKAGQAVEDLHRQAAGMTTDLRSTTRHLERAADLLEQFLERLQANPAETLFGDPPSPRRTE